MIERTRFKNFPTDSVSTYPETQRIKAALFTRAYTPHEVVSALNDIWDFSVHVYDTPLAQVRAVMPMSQEEALVTRMGEVFSGQDDTRSNVIARIPFSHNGEDYGIYYCQIESLKRPVYRPGRLERHEEAVAYGESRRGRALKELPNGFSLHAVEFIDGQARGIFNGQPLDISLDNFVQQLVDLHKICFENPHDPSQQTNEGVSEIVANNPTLAIFDAQGEVVAAGYLEVDNRFTFGGIALVEPTYFTRPGDEYRGHGLSSHLRHAAKELALAHGRINSYGGKQLIIFNESIRNTSFPLCLENGYLLAGDGRITGDLGDAYTTIGPARRETGYMPLGVTYFHNSNN